MPPSRRALSSWWSRRTRSRSRTGPLLRRRSSTLLRPRRGGQLPARRARRDGMTDFKESVKIGEPLPSQTQRPAFAGSRTRRLAFTGGWSRYPLTASYSPMTTSTHRLRIQTRVRPSNSLRNIFILRDFGWLPHHCGTTWYRLTFSQAVRGGLASGSNVDDMRNWLKTLGALVWGTNAQFWPRVVHAETRRELQKRDGAWLADRAREAAEAVGQGEVRVLQRNHQQISSRPMKSHTHRISRGVRGATQDGREDGV